MALTLYRLAEETKKLLDGGDSPLAASVSINEVKIAVCQVANSLLKTDYFQTNAAMGEAIPNGSVLGWYEGTECESWNNRSRIALPVKPIKLPRNMGVFGVYPKFTSDGYYDMDKESIPVQMGQMGLLKSQPLINNMLGQLTHEVVGGDIVFMNDIKSLFPNIQFALRLVILDFAEYGDYDILPLTADLEWEIKRQVVALYSGEPIPDKVVDSTAKEQKNIPVNQQKQS